jgi:hypothetical protein
MASHTAETIPMPSAKVMVRGIQGFILFSIAGTALGIWWKRPTGFDVLLSHLQWPFVALLVPLIAVDHLVGGMRYRLYFDGKILPYVSLWNCMRSNWANIFMGAATPFQTGGGPAQLYILWRCGAKISDGILASLVNFIATLVFFLAATIAAMVLLPADLFGENFAPLLQTGFVAIGGMAGLVLAVLTFPTVGLKINHQLFRLIPLRNRKFLALRDRLLKTLETETHRFRDAWRQILSRHKWRLAVTVAATLVLFFNKYLIGYVIARALGQRVPFDMFIGLQIIQLFMIYFAPTPGASGVAELSSLWLMEKVMPVSVLLIYAVIWRVATTIIGAVIGGVVMLLDMRHWTQRDARSSSRKAAPVLSNKTDASIR